MKYFSAQYIFTNTSEPVKRGIIATEDDGTIAGIENLDGKLHEKHSVEFHNGIIVPGFVNCHCHLELSYLKNEIPAGSGLPGFLEKVNEIRNSARRDKDHSVKAADNEMQRTGTVLCADICNSDSTFQLKKESLIKYISLLEVYGIDPSRAETRMNEILQLAVQAEKMGLPFWIVPHSVYSVSLQLFKLIKKNTQSNRISSIHFLESAVEEELLRSHSGPLMNAYRKFLLPSSELNISVDHIQAIKEQVTSSGNLILVHNTYATREHIISLKDRPGLYWCLCPRSNLIIEQQMPPADLLAAEECNIVIGTDSLGSNNNLSIIEELKTIQEYFPSFSLETLIRWSTINGSTALGDEKTTGSIEPGKKPGLVLLKDVDLLNIRLLPGTTARRLI